MEESVWGVGVRNLPSLGYPPRGGGVTDHKKEPAPSLPRDSLHTLPAQKNRARGGWEGADPPSNPNPQPNPPLCPLLLLELGTLSYKPGLGPWPW